MALLSNVEDLERDNLREDELSTLDPLDTGSKENVETYYEDWGYAMSPEERASGESYKGAVDKDVQSRQQALGGYKSTWSTEMAAADKKAEGILNTAITNKGKITRGTVTRANNPAWVKVRVVKNGGAVEGTYTVRKEVADKLAGTKGIYTSRHGNFLNVDVRAKGGTIIGQELHDAMGGAQSQYYDIVRANERAYNEAVKGQNKLYKANLAAADSDISGLRASIASERKSATSLYDQNVSQQNQWIAKVSKQWGTYVSNNRAAFLKGIETNNGGIRNLMSSGALVFSATVKPKEAT